MRAKTLEQINKQYSRLIWANGCLVGRDNTPQQYARAAKLEEIATRYYFNIKHYFGATTMAMQRGEYDGYKVSRMIYAGF